MGLVKSLFKSPLPAAGNVDVNAMMGAWNVVGVLPTPFEKGLCNPVEIYSWDSEKKRIKVDFHGNKGSVDGPKTSIPQTLYVDSYPESKGKWLASPMWPIKLDYTILDVDREKYSWVVVGHRSRDWLWVMARETTLDDAIMAKALALGKKNGFNTDKIVYPKHST
mmetsp:Transcript_3929/g.6908  ORF Transcript_3929/g.6908 Transcript_3929/m.6908 type:complete len:165 (+) Transcript_3929:262-756(+)|eukprot:CAMPEP_0184527718 /NCGR_PEP_ID=MMETSP0198_2-20121128/11382_1 /TAXON_ID=1112570 /ORGANISM="Thraustochytrium sp., Strain LLF1b" /LENGTH=164 /DNA_ID=CAMNT_0026919465 /DNA_START=283 /DNA_END=777 /DNA_ORIENTATION=-